MSGVLAMSGVPEGAAPPTRDVDANIEWDELSRAIYDALDGYRQELQDEMRLAHIHECQRSWLCYVADVLQYALPSLRRRHNTMAHACVEAQW